MKKPTAILMGSKPASVVALSILLKKGWGVKYVVISKGSSPRWLSGKKVEDLAKEHQIPVVTQDKLPRDKEVDFVISYMYRNLVKPDVLAMAKRAAVNFHAAPLPEYGGWAFYNLAILENASEYGCTCHHMSEKFDTGPILKVRRFPIVASEETAVTLERKTQSEMIKLFIDVCDVIEAGEELPKIPQDPNKMRYVTLKEFETLKKIPDNADRETIERHARAFWYPPYQCAYVEKGDVKLEVVPELAKESLATIIHADDLARLSAVASQHGRDGK